MRTLVRIAGAAIGALLGLTLAIAYDTSAQTSALEGGHRHLTFIAVLVVAAFGAMVGVRYGRESQPRNGVAI